MAVEIKTPGVKPVRNTFAFLEKRFGDKPATRYQEIAYDTQPEVNFHYKPLWDPDRELYDKRRTAIVMTDWYSLKDPRQYYYGSYTITRAKQQDAVDKQMGFVDKHQLLQALPEPAQEIIIKALVTLRHYEWGANLNNCHVAAYGWGTTITQAAMMATTDRLGMAQHLSRIGLLIDGKTGRSLDRAKTYWVNDVLWQPMRREVENMAVLKDWFEVFVAQNLIADGLIYPLFYQHLDAEFSDQYGSVLSSLLDYSLNWHQEVSRWVDAVIKVAASESDDNKALIDAWVAQWFSTIVEACRHAADPLFAKGVDSAMALTINHLNLRLKKMGLASV